MKISRRPSGDTPVGVLGVDLQPLDRASAVRRLPEQIPHPGSFRREDQPAAVGRPHLDNINTSRGCETSERRAAKIPEPEITLLIVDEDRHARAIG